MATPVITHAVEEGLGTAVKQGVQNWLGSSGEAFLKSLGPSGEFLSKYLRDSEQTINHYKSGLQTEVKKVFTSVPESEHSHITEVWSGKVAARNVGVAKAAARLKEIETQVTKMINTTGMASPLGKHPVTKLPLAWKVPEEGPHFYDDAALNKVGSPLREQVIKNIQGAPNTSRADAEAFLDMKIKGQYGRNAIKHVYDNETKLPIGLQSDAVRWQKWAQVSGQKLGEIEHYGINDINLGAIVEGFARQKGRVTAENVASLFDIMLKEQGLGSSTIRDSRVVSSKSAYSSMNTVEKWMRKIGGYAFTSRIAIPHLTQVLNSTINSVGLKRTAEALLDGVTDWENTKNWVVYTGALEEFIQRDLETAMKGGKTWAERILNQPGFHPLRKFEVVIAAHGGKLTAEDAAVSLFKGKDIKKNQEILTQLGLDALNITKRGIITQEELEKAAYTSANQTLFLKSPLNTPFRWEQSPLSRTVAMYRHFSFNQFKFVKNSFKDAYKRGGLPELAKVAGTFAVLFPAAGELVQVAENIIRGKDLSSQDINTKDLSFGLVDDNGGAIDLYINALAHASAFGMGLSLVNSLKRRKLLDNLVGPFISSGAEFVEDVVGAVEGKNKVAEPIRDVTRHVPVVGEAGTNLLLPRSKSKSHHKK